MSIYNTPQVNTGNATFTAEDIFAEIPVTQGSSASLLNLGTVTIEGSTFSDNEMTGLFNDNVATITGATFTGNHSTQNGGAIHNDQDCTMSITNTLLAGNSGVNGAAYWGESNSILSVTGSTISGNTADQNGTLWLDDATATIVSSLFQNNVGKGDTSNGAAIYMTGDSLLNLTGGTFTANTADSHGGAIYAENGTSVIAATNSYFNNNISLILGGGAVMINNGDAFSLDGGAFRSNHSKGHGGAIYSSGDVTVTNVTIDSNASDLAGGFLYNTGSAEIVGSTISNNFAQTDGGVINNTGSFTMTNIVASSNSAGVAAGFLYNSGLTEIYSSTISNSYSPNAGGAIETNGGTVTMYNTLIKGSTATGNGAIAAYSSTLTINGSTFTENQAANAGAIDIGASSNVTITDSFFEKNTGTNGGAIRVLEGSGELTISGSTFTENAAINNGQAGVIYMSSNTSMSISDSVFDSNTGRDASVAYLTTGCSASFNNVLILNNTATTQLWGGNPCAISVHDDATASITGSTFSGNVGTRQGGSISENGGALLNDAGTSVTVEDSQFLTTNDRIIVKGDTKLTGDITTAADIAVQGTGVLTVDDVNFTFVNTEDISVGTMTLANDGVLTINFSNSGTVNFNSVDLSSKPISINTNDLPQGTWTVASGITSVDGATFTVNGVNATLGVPLPNGAILKFADGSLTLSVTSYVVTFTNTLDDCLELAAQVPGLITFHAQTDGTTCTFAGNTIGHAQVLRGNGAANTNVQPASASMAFANGNEITVDSIAWGGIFYGGALDTSTGASSLIFEDSLLKGNIFGGGRANTGNSISNGDIALNISGSTQASGKAIYGGAYANGGTATATSVSLELTDVTNNGNSIYGAGAVNNGGSLEVGNVSTEISGGVYGAIYNGANIYTSGTRNSFSAGTTSLTISSGTFTSVVGNGSTPRDGASSSQSLCNLTIEGGLFNSIVYGGGVSLGGTATNVTVGSIAVNISGGTFNGKVFAGNIGSNGSQASKTVVTDNIDLTVDSTAANIYFNSNLIGGSMGAGVVGGDVTITFKGNGSLLNFGTNSFVSGESEYAYSTTTYVEGEKTLVFDGFFSRFSGNLQGPAFDTVTVKNGSHVNVCGGQVNQNFAFIRTWNFELCNASAVMVTDDLTATNVRNSFWSDTINLTFADNAETMVAGTDWTVYKGKESTIMDWNELAAVTIAGVSATSAMEGDYLAWSTRDYKVYVDSNYDIRLAKLA